MAAKKKALPPSPAALANFQAGRYTPTLIQVRAMLDRAGIPHQLKNLPKEK